MRKRLFILGLVTIVTASMLAGCGNKNTNSATATDTTDTTEASMTITEKKCMLILQRAVLIHLSHQVTGPMDQCLM